MPGSPAEQPLGPVRRLIPGVPTIVCPLSLASPLTRDLTYSPACSHGSGRAKHDHGRPRQLSTFPAASPDPILAALLLIAAAMTLLGVALIAGSLPLVAFGFVIAGAGIGALDLLINVEGAAVERVAGRTLMPRMHAAWSVGAWIGSAYWFTASTSFANPAVTLGRTLTTSYAGIAPASAPGFIAAQITGGILGTGLAVLIYPVPSRTARAGESARLAG